MRFLNGASQPNHVARPVAPAFSPEEHEFIGRWAEAVKPCGLRAESSADHRFLDEAVHVTGDSPDRGHWLLHKTAKGGVAVRLWPGVAEIVGTVPEALAVISRAECLEPVVVEWPPPAPRREG
jgi:hypothetical protein